MTNALEGTDINILKSSFGYFSIKYLIIKYKVNDLPDPVGDSNNSLLLFIVF